MTYRDERNIEFEIVFVSTSMKKSGRDFRLRYRFDINSINHFSAGVGRRANQLSIITDDFLPRITLLRYLALLSRAANVTCGIFTAHTYLEHLRLSRSVLRNPPLPSPFLSLSLAFYLPLMKYSENFPDECNGARTSLRGAASPCAVALARVRARARAPASREKLIDAS